jgi:hypothetical protein
VVDGHAASGGPFAGPDTFIHSAVHCWAQGQCAGRCRIRRRCGRASRAGMKTMCRRRVAPRARACRSLVRVPAARSRLWVKAAQIAHALFAGNRPDGKCARGPSMRSANTVSMIAWRRWVMSAAAVGSVLLVKNGW